MSIFQDLSQIKSDLADRLLHNAAIVACLDETQASTPENLLRTNLFDSFILPQSTATNGTFVCFDVFCPEAEEGNSRVFDWKFRIFSQLNASPIQLDGRSWNRVDGIQKEILLLLEGKSLLGGGYGLDSLHFRACLSYEPIKELCGKELVFRCLGLNPGANRGC